MWCYKVKKYANNGHVSEGHRNQPKGLPPAKLGQLEHKNKLAREYNSLNKVTIKASKLT